MKNILENLGSKKLLVTLAGLLGISGLEDVDTTAKAWALAGQLGAYSTALAEATFQSVGSAGLNWTMANADSGTGTKATNIRVCGDGAEWTNGTASTIAVTEIGIYKATGGAEANLLYSGSFTAVNVGAGASVTIAASGLVITES